MSLPDSPPGRPSPQPPAAPRAAERLRVIDAPGLRLDLSAQAQSPELELAAAALLQQQDFEGARTAVRRGQRQLDRATPRLAYGAARRCFPAMVAHAVQSERERVRQFVRDADAAGSYSSVLHLGIGGSDWGPRLITRALRHSGARRKYASPRAWIRTPSPTR